MIGKRFGMVVVTEQATSDVRKGTRWWILCDCGQKAIVLRAKLVGGYTKSCGCQLRRIQANYKKRTNKLYNFLHSRSK